MASQETASLIDLDDTDLTVADPEIDIRGRAALDKDGQEIGEVKSILIDEKERKVRFLAVESGGFLGIGAETRLVPVDAVTDITETEVLIDQTREHVHGSPAYDPELAVEYAYDDPYFGGLYSHYGYMPFWAGGYAYPAYPRYRRR